MHAPEHAAINAVHCQLELLEDATRALRDPAMPGDERARIARAYFRCAAWEALVGNELTEYQKWWRVKWAKAKAQGPIVDAWAASSDSAQRNRSQLGGKCE